MTVVAPETVYATCVAIDGLGVLIVGSSGSGKSDLALRLIDRGAVLVSDDRCIVAARDDGTASVSPPATIAGKIEVREVGIVSMDNAVSAPLALVVALDNDPPRMPDEDDTIEIARCRVPRLRIDPGQASAPIKVALALQAAMARMA